MTTTETTTSTTTNTNGKVAARYRALLDVAATINCSDDKAAALLLNAAKKRARPTQKDCDELSAAIDVARSVEPEAPAPAPVDESASVLDALKTAVETTQQNQKPAAAQDAAERNAAIEAKRADARRRFETATKATTAHGYALIAAATADGDRMTNLRAKLAEMPEAVRAGACRLAAEKLVQPGSMMQSDLRALFDEQPTVERAKVGRKTTTTDAVRVGRIGDGAQIVIRDRELKSKIGATFTIERKNTVDGKMMIVLTER